MSDKLLVERDGPVTTIIINRSGAKNALDNETAHALAGALHAFDADEGARVAVLTGAGGAFCAGADLKELGSGVDYFPWAGSDEGPLRAPLSKPVIAAIEGHACAGGLGVALFCDIRIVDDTATFGVFSRRWGVPMSDGTTVRLPRVVGMGRALDMLLTGRAVGRRRGDRHGTGDTQGRARHDAGRSRSAGAADRRFSADRHGLGPALDLRGLRPRPVSRDPPRDDAVARSASRDRLALMTDVVAQEVPDRPIVALSGPSFALEVAHHLPTAIVAASTDAAAALRTQQVMSSSAFRVYTQRDVTGVELGGALKNVMAVATGISDGLALGFNARAALITRGLAEMTRLGVKLGADPSTFAGLAGLGDLVLTCTGSLSRNRSVGVEIGRGATLTEVLQGRETVAEGVATTESAKALGAREGVDLPIVNAVHRVLFERQPARWALVELMTRELKGEDA